MASATPTSPSPSEASFPLRAPANRSPLVAAAAGPLYGLTASAISSFTTPAIFVPFPSGYGGQHQVPLGGGATSWLGTGGSTIGGETASAGYPTRGSYGVSNGGGSSWPQWATVVVSAVGGAALLFVLVGICCLAKNTKGRSASRQDMAGRFPPTSRLPPVGIRLDHDQRRWIRDRNRYSMVTSASGGSADFADRAHQRRPTRERRTMSPVGESVPLHNRRSPADRDSLTAQGYIDFTAPSPLLARPATGSPRVTSSRASAAHSRQGSKHILTKSPSSALFPPRPVLEGTQSGSRLPDRLGEARKRESTDDGGRRASF